MWRAAEAVTDVAELADYLYGALLAIPGAVAVVGTRWDGGRLRYIRRLAQVGRAPQTVPPSCAISASWIAGRRPGRPDDGPRLRVRTVTELSHEGAPEPNALRAAGAATALESAFNLHEDDWASLTLGLAPGVEADAELRTRMGQICDIVIVSNRRIVQQRQHAQHQFKDAFLAEASLQMDSSLDVETTVRRVARLAVPAVAEGCVVHLHNDGELAPAALAHVAVSGQRWLNAVAADDRWLAAALRSGVSSHNGVLLQGDELRGGPFGPGGDAPGRAVRAVSISPLRARGRVLGTLTFLYHRPAEDIGDLGLLRDLASRAALAIDNSTLYEQRRQDVASLQRHLLPQTLPEIAGLRFSAGYEVADTTLDVGGDFYDVVCSAPGEAALFVGDVCGRGAEAAALTGLARHTLRTLLEDRSRPELALSRLNSALVDERTSRFVTALVAVLTAIPGGFHATVVSAGHPPPLVRLADGSVREVPASGLLLGVLPTARFTAASVILGPGDSLVMFTDGLTEARAADGAFFEPFLPAAVSRYGRVDPDGAAVRLIEAAADFRERGADDSAVLIAYVEDRTAAGPVVADGEGRT